MKVYATERGRRIAEALRGQPLSQERRLALSVAQKRAYAEGRRACTFTTATQAKTAAKASLRTGDKHPRWVADRSKLSYKGSNRSMAHETWRRAVRRRFPRCVIGEGAEPCDGRLEAHHIESFSARPELRYDVDNGVTLCRKHHPRKQSEVEKLAPSFKAKVQSWKG